MSGQTSVLDIEEFSISEVAGTTDIGPGSMIQRDCYFELGQWLCGLESFCSVGSSMFVLRQGHSLIDRRISAGFNICRSVISKCAELLRSLRAARSINQEIPDSILAEIERFIPAALVLNNSLSRSTDVGHSEWNAWCETLTEKVGRLKIAAAFDRLALRAGADYLHEVIGQIDYSGDLSFEERRDLDHFFPRLGALLLTLRVVKRMLDADVPIAPSLAIFAYMNEAINDLIIDINDRIAVHPNESSDHFAMLDASSYTLSIETKKVFAQELAMILDVRSATAAFARVESAYGILNENIKQLLAGFAHLANPDLTTTEMFPDFHAKLAESIELRASLWSVLQSVRRFESKPSVESMLGLRITLDEFRSGPANSLFYKDRETFDRFCAEISLTGDLKDAVPIVHRFSAYTETLFSLVSMRAVLANHPISMGE